MGRLIAFARIYVAVIGFEFLFGQFFNSVFSVVGSVIGVMAMTTAALSSPKATKWVRYFATLACVAAMTGIALHVAEYYSMQNVRGDYYPWVITAPLVVALAFLAGSNLGFASPMPEAASRE